MSVLIWVQTDREGYQQMTKVVTSSERARTGGLLQIGKIVGLSSDYKFKRCSKGENEKVLGKLYNWERLLLLSF